MIDIKKSKLNVGDKVRIRFSRDSLIKYFRDIGDMTFEEFVYLRENIVGCDGREGTVLAVYDDCVYVDVKAKDIVNYFKYDDIEEIK